MDDKILKEIIKDSKIMSKKELINKYRDKGIEIEYHKDIPEFVTFDDKNNKETINIQELNKYFDEIDKKFNNMSEEEFDQILIDAGIENYQENNIESISNLKPICPYCGKVHSIDYIPKECGDGDEFYIRCENCNETFTVDVIFDCEYIEENLEATFKDCLKTNNIMFNCFRQDDKPSTIESPY